MRKRRIDLGNAFAASETYTVARPKSRQARVAREHLLAYSFRVFTPNSPEDWTRVGISLDWKQWDAPWWRPQHIPEYDDPRWELFGTRQPYDPASWERYSSSEAGPPRSASSGDVSLDAASSSSSGSAPSAPPQKRSRRDAADPKEQPVSALYVGSTSKGAPPSQPNDWHVRSGLSDDPFQDSTKDPWSRNKQQ